MGSDPLHPEDLSRREILAMLGVGGAASLAGCSGGDGGSGDGGAQTTSSGDGGSQTTSSGDGGSQTTTSADEGDGGDKQMSEQVFVSGLQKEPTQNQFNNYNPNRAAHGDESITIAFWSPIVEYHPGKNEYVADLAENWEFEQGESVTVTLREGLKWWPDEKPVTAGDIVAQKRMDRHVYGADTGLWKYTSEISAEDERTVKATLDTNVNPQIYLQTAFHQDVLFVHEGKYEDFIQRYEDATSDSEIKSVTQDLLQTSFDEPFGYGAWQIDEITPQKISASPWEGYWAYDEINFNREFIPTFWETRPQVQKQAMVGGELDGSPTITGGIQEKFMNRVPGDPVFPKVPTFNGFGIDINHTKKPFDDRRVRKALAYATDHAKMASIDFGHEEVDSKFTGMSNYYAADYLTDEVSSNLVDYGPQDLEAAQSLMEEAGYKKQGNKLVDSSGKQFSAELKTIGGRVPWAQIFKENMASLGADIKVSTVENSRFFGVTVPNGDFEIALWTASGWKRHHPFGDYSLTWLPSSSPWAKGTQANLQPEVPWPPGTTDGSTQQVDIEAKIKELGTAPEDRATELVNQLAWIYNQTMPQVRITERHLVAMIQTDDWQVPDQGDPDMKVPNPLNWMPKVGKLKAKQ
jgi:peptide/nickel transport system substrate-binding protein